MLRMGVVGIIVTEKTAVMDVQQILSDNSEIIIGRMGVPDRETGVNAISVIVKGTVEQISSLSGKLGKLHGISVKSALAL